MVDKVHLLCYGGCEPITVKLGQAAFFHSGSEIQTDGIQGQSPVHFSLPTSQINISLVFSWVCPQHQLPEPTPGLHDAVGISTC